MRRAVWLLVALASAWAACSETGELTCEQDGGCDQHDLERLRAAIAGALDEKAVVLSSLQPLSTLQNVQARVFERRDGGAVVVLWTRDDPEAAASPAEKTAAIAFVDPNGVITPLATPTPVLSVFQGPPRGVEYGAGAVFVTCGTGATGGVWIVDPTQPTVTTSTETAVGACNTSNSPVRPMFGRALDPNAFVAASGQEIGIYRYSGTTLVKDKTFPSAGSFYAWVEEIEPGVLAWLSWSNLQGNISGTWTYHRSDTGAGLSFENSAAIVLDAYDESGLESVRRLGDGSLLIATGKVAGAASGTGVFRWNVQSDGKLVKLAENPEAPFGEWRALSGWASVTTDFQPNPRAPQLVTPIAHAVGVLEDTEFSFFGSRNTPCNNEALCKRIGESYTLAVLGAPGRRVAVQALWTWASLQGGTSAVVVAVPTGETPLSSGSPPDASLDGPGIDTGVADAGSEEGAAPCPAACGVAGCDPLGGCAVEPVKSGSMVVSISTGNGVAWLQRGATFNSSTLWWIAPGAPLSSLSSVASANQVSPRDRVVADNLGAFFHDYFALSFTNLPPTGAPTGVVGSGAVPDSLRLIGATPTHVLTAQTGLSPIAIRRWTRGTWQSELLACTPDWADGTLDASERVFAALGSGVVRFDGKLQAGANCQGTNAGVPVDAGSPVAGVLALALGTSRLYGLTTNQVFAFDPNATAAPVAIGPAQIFSGTDASFPLATDGDAVIYVAPGPLPTTSANYAVVVVESPGATPHVLATSVGAVTALASNGTHVYLADERGLVRVPRTQGP